jgi:hypothetical protein
MAVSAVKIRAFIGAVFATVVLIGFAAIGTTVMGFNIPILRNIAAVFGVTGE